MKTLSAELVETIRAANPIEQIISEHVQLRRSGVQLMGRCPFHPDKTPSFSVHPGKAVFHCHGCMVGGDVFDFVMRIEGTSFPDAAKLLAGRAGIPLQSVSPQEAKRLWTERKHENEAAARLLELEHAAFFEVCATCLQLENIYRLASDRLDAIHNGSTERFRGEEDFCWFALADVFNQMPWAAAAYNIMAFGTLDMRVRLALHPEDRDHLIQDVLEAGRVGNHDVLL